MGVVKGEQQAGLSQDFAVLHWEALCFGNARDTAAFMREGGAFSVEVLATSLSFASNS
jgi:hypothetical protein